MNSNAQITTKQLDRGGRPSQKGTTSKIDDNSD